MGDVVHWGILGCARIVQEAIIPAMEEAANATALAIASRDLQKAKRWAEQYGIPRAYGTYEELLRDPEVQAVYIPLPNHLHLPWTRRAAQFGKHVLCEKPLAPTATQAHTMVRFCRRNRVFLMEAFMYRFHAQHSKVLELIDSGRIGEPKQIIANFTFTLAPGDNIRLNATMGGGSLLDIGSYCVNVSRMLFRSEPLQVFGWSNTHPEREVDMTFWGAMRFPEGRCAFFCSSFELAPEQSYTIKGTRGTIHVPNAYLPPYPTHIIVNGETIEVNSRNQYTLEVECFSKAILTSSGVPYPLADTLKNIAVLDALAASARRRKAMVPHYRMQELKTVDPDT